MEDLKYAFLDRVVERFGETAKNLIGEAESTSDLNHICYGSLLAACILHCEKHGIEEGRAAVLELVHQIFDERRERERILSEDEGATFH